MKVAAANLDAVFGGVSRMTGGFRTLTEQAPKTFAATDTLFADNSDTMVQLLGDPHYVHAADVRAGSGAQRAVPDRSGLVVRLAEQHHPRRRILGQRRHLPALCLRLRNPRHPPSSADYRSRSCTPTAATTIPLS